MRSSEKFIAILAALSLSVLICGCFGGESEPPVLTTDEKEIMIFQIEKSAGVQDAAINQDGKKLTLTLVVDYGTSEEYAKELGDGFVRLVKGVSPDEGPGKEIGPGIYDYVVGVYYPNGDLVAMGAKTSNARNLYW